MILRINPWRVILTFLAAFLLLSAVLFAILFNIFLDFPWDFRQPLIISIFILSSIFFLVLSLTKNYYELTKKYIKVKRLGRELIYYFSDVVYIDEEKSVKKKMVHFYTKQGHPRYLTFDKNGIIYKTMLEKCQNRMSKEEFYKKHPDVKL